MRREVNGDPRKNSKKEVKRGDEEDGKRKDPKRGSEQQNIRNREEGERARTTGDGSQRTRTNYVNPKKSTQNRDIYR